MSVSTYSSCRMHVSIASACLISVSVVRRNVRLDWTYFAFFSWRNLHVICNRASGWIRYIFNLFLIYTISRRWEQNEFCFFAKIRMNKFNEFDWREKCLKSFQTERFSELQGKSKISRWCELMSLSWLVNIAWWRNAFFINFSTPIHLIVQSAQQRKLTVYPHLHIISFTPWCFTMLTRYFSLIFTLKSHWWRENEKGWWTEDWARKLRSPHFLDILRRWDAHSAREDSGIMERR